jgi:hypothetical protein
VRQRHDMKVFRPAGHSRAFDWLALKPCYRRIFRVGRGSLVVVAIVVAVGIPGAPTALVLGAGGVMCHVICYLDLVHRRGASAGSEVGDRANSMPSL